MRFKPDKRLRDGLFTAESLLHPAKGHLGLWWEILERYTQPSEWVLDPMAGVGATMLGVLMGRHVICVELEQHFIDPMKASWEKMRQSPMLGHTLGQVVILRGDARCLPLGRADCIVTSPPWENQIHAQDPKWLAEQKRLGRFKGGFGLALQGGYTRPDAIITSPPYEGSIQGQPRIDFTKMDGGKRDMTREAAQRTRVASLSGYTRPVDAVLTSPPFEDQQPFQDKNFNLHGTGPVSQTRPSAITYGKGENIGNLRGDKYWEAMRLVYQECHRVLRPQSLMVLVLKGFTRDGEYIDLPAQTRALVETLGFRFVEQWERELWKLSFWRVLQGSEKRSIKLGLQMGLTEGETQEVIRQYRVSNGRLDPRLRFEQVLVMERR